MFPLYYSADFTEDGEERREDNPMFIAIWFYGAATLLVFCLLSCVVITMLVLILRSRNCNGYEKMNYSGET